MPPVVTGEEPESEWSFGKIMVMLLGRNKVASFAKFLCLLNIWTS